MQAAAIASSCPPKTPRLFWWCVAASLMVALVPTVWLELDLSTARLFTGPTARTDAVHWWWVEWINFYIPTVFRWIVLIALVGWALASIRTAARHWRLELAFLVLAITLGPGILVNHGFKDHWQRARPYQVEDFGGTQKFTRAAVMTDQCDNNCSFVSGHVSCGFFLISLMLLQRKRRVFWALLGTAAGGAIGFARMADSAHWLSDVLWACPITLICSWLVWQVLLRVYPTQATEPTDTSPSDPIP
ncbi:MAG: phosphatase PAP2 family protein [Rhodoferax sp.]|nr:phosphatase PAP2 family protein [Rhodoferax sp.]